MGHIYHPDEDVILMDGCEECEYRSRNGVDGLLDLDNASIELLWKRMLNTRFTGMRAGEEAGRFRSDAEARLGAVLYRVGALLGRFDESPSEALTWRPETFTKGKVVA